MMKKILVLLVAFCCMTLMACTNRPLKRYDFTFLDVFDTQTVIIGYEENQEAFQSVVDEMKEELNYFHRLYDIYNEYPGINNLKTVNEHAGIAPVKVPREIIDLLEFSKEMFYFTDGKVNVAMGSVLSIWHEYREKGVELPSLQMLTEASQHMDIEKVIIDEKASTVYLEDPEMLLDVGSVGKGYAVQKVVQGLEEKGIRHYLLNVGGNVYAIDGKDDGTDWKVGITNPDQESATTYAETVAISDKCVVTSGDYQRYYEVDGIRYCHIIDPDSLMPPRYVTSVSVVTGDSGMADALSTALFNTPLEEGIRFVNEKKNLEAMWILDDGKCIYSDGFEGLLNEKNEK